VSRFVPSGRGRRPRLFLALAVFAASPPRAGVAHEVFAACVQHEARLTVSARHVDLTLELTFFEDWSARERLAMDADGNGRVSRREAEHYARNLAARIAGAVTLRVGGRPLPLAPLYDPEVDLLGTDRVGPAHHRLRLVWFARTPTLRAGDEVVVEDSLWLKATALGTGRAGGEDGATFEAKPPGDAAPVLLPPGEPRRFTFRCVKPPATVADAKRTAQ
jgi:hypothetical protein